MSLGIDACLVKKVTYSFSAKLLTVSLDLGESGTACLVCGVIWESIRRRLVRDLGTEFEREFSDLFISVE